VNTASYAAGLAAAAQRLVQASRVELEPDSNGSHHVVEIRVPFAEWSALARAVLVEAEQVNRGRAA
jgi:uncharacterized membrane protein YgcG